MKWFLTRSSFFFFVKMLSFTGFERTWYFPMGKFKASYVALVKMFALNVCSLQEEKQMGGSAMIEGGSGRPDSKERIRTEQMQTLTNGPIITRFLYKWFLGRCCSKAEFNSCKVERTSKGLSLMPPVLTKQDVKHLSWVMTINTH